MEDNTKFRDNISIGRQIGNYRIIKELSSTGGFGKVYLGEHVVFTDQLPVAIKLLRPHLASQEEKKRFIQEAHFLKMLKHPNILPIIEAGIQDDLPYLVVEYASNGSLKELLQKHSSNLLPMQEALTILRQIGNALHYVHQQKVIHRDLKPDNILFNAQGKAVLADFGIAVILEKTGLVGYSGTPPYMAPEQFKGKVSRKSDQYALSCVAYELVTGHRVFTLPKEEATWWAWADKHINESPIPPSQDNPHLSKRFERAILKALAKERDVRHPDIFTFIAELKAKDEWLADGNTYYEAQCYEEALEVFEYAIRLDEDYAPAYTGKGNALYSLSRYKEALDFYEHGIQLDPNNAINWRKKGNIFTVFERGEEAQQAYERASQLDVLQVLNESYRLFQTGDYVQAISLLSTLPKTITNEVPQNLLLRHALGEKLQARAEAFFEEEGEPEEGKKAFRLAMEIDYLRADEYLAQLGNCYLHLRNYTEASKAFLQALNKNSSNWVALLGQSEFERNEGNLLKALELVEIATRSAPKEYQLWNQKGVLLIQLNQYEEAIAAYEQALSLSPDDPNVLINKANALERRKLLAMKKKSRRS